MELKPINLKDLVGDPESRILRIRDRKRPARLREKEYLALQALFLSNGFAVSEEDILESMVGRGALRCEKLVQVTIGTIRKKIGRRGRDIIKRVKNYGYRINRPQFIDPKT
jgi:DNA-binding response OmpR family regulator